MNHLFVPTDLPPDFFEDKSSPKSKSEIELKLEEIEEEVEEVKAEQDRRTAKVYKEKESKA